MMLEVSEFTFPSPGSSPHWWRGWGCLRNVVAMVIVAGSISATVIAIAIGIWITLVTEKSHYRNVTNSHHSDHGDVRKQLIKGMLIINIITVVIAIIITLKTGIDNDIFL